MYDILNIEKCSGNQKFGLAGCEKMAMMRFGLIFDNVLLSKPLLSLATNASQRQIKGDLRHQRHLARWYVGQILR